MAGGVLAVCSAGTVVSAVDLPLPANECTRRSGNDTVCFRPDPFAFVISASMSCAALSALSPFAACVRGLFLADIATRARGDIKGEPAAIRGELDGLPRFAMTVATLCAENFNCNPVALKTG